jgi:hypothetical protein
MACGAFLDSGGKTLVRCDAPIVASRTSAGKTVRLACHAAQPGRVSFDTGDEKRAVTLDGAPIAPSGGGTTLSVSMPAGVHVVE